MSQSVVQSDHTVNQLVECIREGFLSTFAMIQGCELTYMGYSHTRSSFDGIIGTVSMVGDIAWSVMLCIPRSTAIALTPKFAGFHIDYDDPDMGDVVGELANVVGGDILARFDEIGVKTELSLPTVAKGTDIYIHTPSSAPSERMCFSSDNGVLWVDIAAAVPSRVRRPGV